MFASNKVLLRFVHILFLSLMYLLVMIGQTFGRESRHILELKSDAELNSFFSSCSSVLALSTMDPNESLMLFFNAVEIKEIVVNDLHIQCHLLSINMELEQDTLDSQHMQESYVFVNNNRVVSRVGIPYQSIVIELSDAEVEVIARCEFYNFIQSIQSENSILLATGEYLLNPPPSTIEEFESSFDHILYSSAFEESKLVCDFIHPEETLRRVFLHVRKVADYPQPRLTVALFRTSQMQTGLFLTETNIREHIGLAVFFGENLVLFPYDIL